MQVFENELRGKTVMTVEGSFLGVLRNVSANKKTGDLSSLHVELAPELESRNFVRDGKNRAVLPFASIRAVRDVIVVQA